MKQPWTITVERQELDRVCSVLGQAPPLETNHDGIWVMQHLGVRFWTCSAGPVQWEIAWDISGTGAPELPSQCLPGRVVWHAGELARRAATETVTISIPDPFVAVAEADGASAVVDLPSTPYEPELPDHVGLAAQAVLSVAELYNLCGRTRLAPCGNSDAHPPMVLAVADGFLATTVDWAGYDGFRSTYRVPAHTSGSARSVVPLDVIMDLLHHIDSDDDVSVGFPDDPSEPLLLSTTDLRAAIQRGEVGAKRHHDALGQALADASGKPCRILDRGIFQVEFANRSVRAELADVPAETIRLTCLVANRIEHTHDVLVQLNDMNRSLVGGRIWIHDGTVIAGLDLPYEAIGQVGAVMGNLTRQIDGLDVFLSALGKAA